MHGELRTNDNLFLPKIPTDGRVDSQKISFERPVVVSSTYQYKTVGGTRTVFVLEQIDPEWLKAEFKKRLPPSTVNRIVEALAKAEAGKARSRQEGGIRKSRSRQASGGGSGRGKMAHLDRFNGTIHNQG